MLSPPCAAATQAAKSNTALYFKGATNPNQKQAHDYLHTRCKGGPKQMGYTGSLPNQQQFQCECTCHKVMR